MTRSRRPSRDLVCLMMHSLISQTVSPGSHVAGKAGFPVRVACLLAWIPILARVAMTAGSSGVEPADMPFGAYILS